MTARVALVNMPFVSTLWPSLGLSLLSAALKRDGIACDIHYLNVRFAARLESKTCRLLNIGWPHNTTLLGEWLFSSALSAEVAESESSYVNDVLRPAIRLREVDWSESKIEETIARMLRVRENIAP